ncbi:MAG TPA: GMC family oxidoreductase [Actinomycetes bacterium]|nr:GMC family oxidoreductase [Actinomycetes bacterium]
MGGGVHRGRTADEGGRQTVTDYDVVVVGSGFGGSVAALRLTEKGYRVAVLEAGRRFADHEFARTSWDVRRFLWAPRLGCYGIQRIHRLPHVTVLAGAGVGGGSLVYANTLYQPDDAFYDDPQWAGITDWRTELAPYFVLASRMLGVVRNPTVTPSDEAMREVAEQMGAGGTFTLTPVGVFFGPAPGVTVEDPFFDGAGPARTGCVECGACMTGCRHGAKNTLPKNYLWLAERAGADVLPLTTVTAVRPDAGGGYAVDTVRTGAWTAHRTRRTVTASQVVLAAGTYGTQRLLHRMRDDGHLRHLSPRLGELTRTNSESLVGARSRRRDVDFSRGVAITSSFRPAPHTHVEPVRYGRGSNLMGLLGTALTDGGGPRPRWVTWLREQVRHPVRTVRTLSLRHWSERTVIGLVMQSLDNSLVVSGHRGRLGRWRLTTRHGHGAPSPTWVPEGNEAVRRLARVIDGEPGGTYADLLGSPLTAHFLGGAVIGPDPERGVVDGWHRVFGHPGLHVVDGAAVSANLGANPSLTITAQAERAMAFWPNADEPDPRPPLGAPYHPVAPVPAYRPVVRGRTPQ